jgi:hypothetical protein
MLKCKLNPSDAKREASQPKIPLCGTGSLVAMRNGELCEVITLRTYFNEKGSGMQPVRACVWITPAVDGPWHSGRGSASGCGYHKESAAIADACEAAGVQLFGNAYARQGEKADYKKPFYFGGTGSSGYETIFKAIGRAAGYKGSMVWVSHGLWHHEKTYFQW